MALARIKKKERSAETHGKHYLGALADLAGWEKIEIDLADRHIAKLADRINQGDENSEFSRIGKELFVKAKREDFFKKRQAQYDPDQWKSEVRYRIILGGIWIKYGMGAESKALMLGAMFSEKP